MSLVKLHLQMHVHVVHSMTCLPYSLRGRPGDSEHHFMNTALLRVKSTLTLPTARVSRNPGSSPGSSPLFYPCICTTECNR